MLFLSLRLSLFYYFSYLYHTTLLSSLCSYQFLQLKWEHCKRWQRWLLNIKLIKYINLFCIKWTVELLIVSVNFSRYRVYYKTWINESLLPLDNIHELTCFHIVKKFIFPLEYMGKMTSISLGLNPPIAICRRNNPFILLWKDFCSPEDICIARVLLYLQSMAL